MWQTPLPTQVQDCEESACLKIVHPSVLVAAFSHRFAAWVAGDTALLCSSGRWLWGTGSCAALLTSQHAEFVHCEIDYTMNKAVMMGTSIS